MFGLSASFRVTLAVHRMLRKNGMTSPCGGAVARNDEAHGITAPITAPLAGMQTEQQWHAVHG